MKIKPSRTIKNSIVLLLILNFLISCEKETLIEDNENQQIDFKVKTLSFNE